MPNDYSSGMKAASEFNNRIVKEQFIRALFPALLICDWPILPPIPRLAYCADNRHDE
jgi:hypothetical protein